MSGLLTALGSVLPTSGGGGGSPALIAHTAAGGTPDDVTSSAINTTGANLLVVACAHYFVNQPTITDSKGNTYTALSDYGSTGDQGIRLFYSFGGTVGSGHTFTASGTTIYPAVAVLAFSNIASSPFDAESGAFSAPPNVAPGSITPSQANTVIVTGLGINGLGSGSDITVNSGFTITDTVPLNAANSFGVSAAYKILTAATATNPLWGNSNIAASGMAASQAVFKY